MSDEEDYMGEGDEDTLTEEQLNEILSTLKGKFVLMKDLNDNIIKGTLVRYDGQEVRVSSDSRKGKYEVGLPVSRITSLTWAYEEDGKVGRYTLEF